MRVRWTTDAADDLERICDYIAESRPDSAPEIARAIVQGVSALDTFPNRGRSGRVEGTRELVFPHEPHSTGQRYLADIRRRNVRENSRQFNGPHRPHS